MGISSNKSSMLFEDMPIIYILRKVLLEAEKFSNSIE